MILYYVTRSSWCTARLRRSPVVEEIMDQLWWYCADLSTSMTVGTDVEQNILNSVFEGAKAGGQCGRHNGKNQYDRQSLFDFVITL